LTARAAIVGLLTISRKGEHGGRQACICVRTISPRRWPRWSMARVRLPAARIFSPGAHPAISSTLPGCRTCAAFRVRAAPCASARRPPGPRSSTPTLPPLFDGARAGRARRRRRADPERRAPSPAISATHPPPPTASRRCSRSTRPSSCDRSTPCRACPSQTSSSAAPHAPRPRPARHRDPRGRGRGTARRAASRSSGARRYLVISIVGGRVPRGRCRRPHRARRVAVGACSPVARRLPALEAARRTRPAVRPRRRRDRRRTSPGSHRSTTCARPAATGSTPRDARRRGSSTNSDLPRVSRMTIAFTLNGAPCASKRTAGATPRRRAPRHARRLTASRSAATPAIAAPAPCCSTARQVCACLTPVGQAEGRSVTTIEGRGDTASSAESSEPSTRTAAQCGICTPGMIAAATSCCARRRAGRTRRSSTRSAACCAAAPATGRSSRPCRRARADVAPAADDRLRSARGSRAAKVDGESPRDGDRRSSAPTASPADALSSSRDPLAARPRALHDRRPRREHARPHPGARARADGARRSRRERLRHLSRT
jgi:aerobic-type carbon monoxide dehydrogenase small subunit (CoxS/CutS family)